jgi:hypothetical protein
MHHASLPVGFGIELTQRLHQPQTVKGGRKVYQWEGRNGGQKVYHPITLLR